MHERNISVAILGENGDLNEYIGHGFGKPGQKTDLHFFNRLEAERGIVFCAIASAGYPDKLKSAIQSAVLGNHIVVTIDAETGPTAATGELILLSEVFVKYRKSPIYFAVGNINPKNEYKLDKIREKLNIIKKNTALKDAEIIVLREKEDRELLKEKIIEKDKEIVKKETNDHISKNTYCLIDHCFPVKGVGTVVLGVVMEGILKAGTMMHLVRLGKKVLIRSIQKQDRDFKEAYPGDRVGLALKGIKPEDIDRNEILTSSPTRFITPDRLKLKINVNKYFDGIIKPGDSRNYTVYINLSTAPVSVTNGDAVEAGKTGIITVKPGRKIPVPTADGWGIMGDPNKFTGKPRIIGDFEILMDNKKN